MLLQFGAIKSIIIITIQSNEGVKPVTLLEKLLAIDEIPFRKDCPLAPLSTFHIGGNADFAVFPKTVEQLLIALRLCRKENVPYFLVGNGSNLLFPDEGLCGAVLFTKGMNAVADEPDGFFAESGVGLPVLSRRAATRGLSGLEFACGIPGTVGGAVYMNAGAHGGEMADVIVETAYYDAKTDTCGKLLGPEHAFGYRTSVFTTHPEMIILGAHIRLQSGDPNAIRQRISENLALRRQKQPIGEAGAGSAFKRPAKGSAAELIDACGLKGLSVGGATVSEKHAGFIVNRGGATAKDVVELMKKIRETVFAKTGILLEPEIRIFGKI